eukprot:2784-Heterococcus_DN1.PRE.6
MQVTHPQAAIDRVSLVVRRHAKHSLTQYPVWCIPVTQSVRARCCSRLQLLKQLAVVSKHPFCRLQCAMLEGRRHELQEDPTL